VENVVGTFTTFWQKGLLPDSLYQPWLAKCAQPNATFETFRIWVSACVCVCVCVYVCAALVAVLCVVCVRACELCAAHTHPPWAGAAPPSRTPGARRHAVYALTSPPLVLCYVMPQHGTAVLRPASERHVQRGGRQGPLRPQLPPLPATGQEGTCRGCVLWVCAVGVCCGRVL
jgi:hypothetical protein